MTPAPFHSDRASRGERHTALAVVLAVFAVLLPAYQAGAADDSLAGLHDRLDGMTPQQQLEYLDTYLDKGVTDARIHFFKGNAFFAIEQYDSSIAEFKRAVEIDKDYAKAYVNMGIVLDTTRKFLDARSAYERAIEINPEDVLAYCHLGFNYYSGGQHETAMECYQKALRIDPNSAQAHYNLGLAFANAKIFEEALVEWRKVIEVDPDGQLGKMAAENVQLIKTYMELVE